eukprot:3624730-Amphidinium_carterae.1
MSEQAAGSKVASVCFCCLAEQLERPATPRGLANFYIMRPFHSHAICAIGFVSLLAAVCPMLVAKLQPNGKLSLQFLEGFQTK